MTGVQTCALPISSAEESDQGETADYVIDDAYQGAEAIRMVDSAAEEGFPYALIFMDVRMPPGMDGIQAITEIWKRHPQIEMVICTAYSDYSWDQIVEQFGSTEHLLFMKKPFDSIALKQTALSLTSKWDTANRKSRYVEELETEINQRTQQLNEMMDHLRQIKKETESLTIAKNRFFASITSEMQTPLNGILGVTDLLLDTELNEEQRSFAETIKQSGNSLLLIINDILNFSRDDDLASGSQEIVFDLRTAIDSVIDLISVAATEKEIEMTCFVDCHVNELFIGDPFKLRQVLLLSLTHIVNTEESCEIVVAVSNKSENADEKAELLFEISKLEKISVGYSRRERIFRQSRSTMLSSLSESIKFPRQEQIEATVKKMDGDFRIDSDPDTGLVISFSATFGISAPSFLSIDLSSTIIGMRCLVISDHSTSRKILSLHINHWGGISKGASHKDNIVEKINLAKESNLPYDAVVVDLKEEPLETYQTIASEIQENCRRYSVNLPKLICLTANAKRGDAQKIERFGYSVYLTKPIKQSHLFKSLILVKSLKDENRYLDPSKLITKHFVDEFTPDYFKVLVSHEDPSALNMIISCLARLKVRCDVSDSRSDLSSVMKKSRYDLILVDCWQCQAEDFRAIQQMKASLPYLKIVLMMEESDADSKAAVTDLDIDDIIYKPITSQSLVDMLQRNLNN